MLRWFLSQDAAATEAGFRRRAQRIAEHLKSVPSVETEIFIPPAANHVPHLLITYDPDRIKITGQEGMEKMRQGKPQAGPAVECSEGFRRFASLL